MILASLVVKLALDGENFNSGIKKSKPRTKGSQLWIYRLWKCSQRHGQRLNGLKTTHKQLSETLTVENKRLGMYSDALKRQK